MNRLIMAFCYTTDEWYYLCEEYRPNFGKQYWFVGYKENANVDESHLEKLVKLYPEIKFKLID